MPFKPVLERCHLDAPRLECICGKEDKPEDIYRKPLDYCDKGTVLRPEEWAKKQAYEQELEETLKRVIEKGRQNNLQRCN